MNRNIMEMLDNDNVPACIIMVGLPGSGKSTVCKHMLGGNPDGVVISTDDMLEEIAAAEGLTYSEVFAENIDTVTKLARARFAHAIKDRRSVVVDRTNLTAKSRRSWTSGLPSGYVVGAFYVETDEDKRQERMAARTGKHIPAEADARMREQYTIPDFSEGFDMITGLRT